MDAHADPDLAVWRPRLRPQRTLALDGGEDGAERGRNGAAGAGECDEEAVALVGDLLAAVGAEDGAEQALVGVKHHGVVAIAEPAQQARRALDVGEEERHRTRSVSVAHHSTCLDEGVT
jgi:hypothetical protein